MFRSLPGELASDVCALPADDRAWWQRLLNRCFPPNHIPVLEDVDGWAPAYLMQVTVSRLDWLDRLRVLISGRICIETRTKTDVVVRRMYGESTLYALPPCSQRRAYQGPT